MLKRALLISAAATMLLWFMPPAASAANGWPDFGPVKTVVKTGPPCDTHYESTFEIRNGVAYFGESKAEFMPDGTVVSKSTYGSYIYRIIPGSSTITGKWVPDDPANKGCNPTIKLSQNLPVLEEPEAPAEPQEEPQEEPAGGAGSGQQMPISVQGADGGGGGGSALPVVLAVGVLAVGIGAAVFVKKKRSSSDKDPCADCRQEVNKWEATLEGGWEHAPGAAPPGPILATYKINLEDAKARLAECEKTGVCPPERPPYTIQEFRKRVNEVSGFDYYDEAQTSEDFNWKQVMDTLNGPPPEKPGS